MLKKGDLAIVGGTYAVADLCFMRFAAFSAWIIWATAPLYFLIGFANRLFVLLQWGFDFLTERRRVRVLPGKPPSTQDWIDPAAWLSRKLSVDTPFTRLMQLRIGCHLNLWNAGIRKALNISDSLFPFAPLRIS